MRSKKLLIILGLIALLIAAGIYYRSFRSQEVGNGDNAQVVLRLGYRPAALADVTPVIINENKDLITGLKIQTVPVANPQIALQKFDAGEVDALAGIPLEAILKRMEQRGDPGFRAYYFQVDLKGEGWVSLVGNGKVGVATVKDLAGKTVASLPTDQAQYLVREILLAAGIAERDIKIVTYNPASPLTGLKSGEHVAIFGLEPAISRARSEGYTVIAAGPVSEYLYQGRPVPVSASVVSEEFLAKHPGSFDKLMNIMDQAVAIQSSEPDKVRNYFAKADYGGLEDSVRKQLFLPVMRKADASLVEIFGTYVNNLSADGLLKSKININDLLN